MARRLFRILTALTAFALARDAFAQEGAPAPGTANQAEEIALLKAEVERLRSIVPAQAVAMTQVAYNFSNLWFAVEQQNWPLAQFYFNETRTRLRWAMRIAPVRKISSGEVELGPLLDVLEQGDLAALGRIVENKDVSQFAGAYDKVLNGCYGCHVASEKPFLRLKVPAAPAEGMIIFEND